jgi:hypothetical protein
MPWEQLFGSFQRLLLIDSETWRYRDAFGQVSDYVDQQAQCLSGQVMVL